MKKIITLLSVCLFLAVGCKDNKEVGAENVSSMEQANMIIEYTNSVVDYMNKANSKISSNESNFDKLLKFADKKKVKSYEIPLDVSLADYNFSANKDEKDKIIQPPSVLSVEEQEFFKEKGSCL
ncbi:hypothetical protein [Myroides odoratimimus]|uniref:hypothetical protein n=1 Tax=Myroides odoratimimus TaxID=76832 RepID=UPI0031011C66